MYRFVPIHKTLIWGTEKWVISAVPGNESVVSEGPQAGKKLTEIYPGQFPLLIKFIDADKDLSIQVHPDDEFAMKHGGRGKAEMWYITDAEQDAHLLSGLKKEIPRDEYIEVVESGRIVDYLCDHKVNRSDVFFLPAGRVHSICKGCHLIEIQQSSDTTYRLYDYDRVGLDGKPRPLHTELARDAIDYKVYDDYRTHYKLYENKECPLVECSYFTTSIFKIARDMECEKPGKGWCSIVCAEGKGYINGECIQKGEAVLLAPEETTLSFKPEKGDFTVLSAFVTSAPDVSELKSSRRLPNEHTCNRKNTDI